jgi:hypothetical protein
MPLATGSATSANTMGIVRVSRLDGSGRHGPACQDDVGLQADQLPRERWCPIGVIAEPTEVKPHVAAFGPTQFRKRLLNAETRGFAKGSFSS